MVTIDTDNIGGHTTLQKRCTMQFEFPLLLKSDSDDIKRVMKDALSKYNTNFTFEKIKGKDNTDAPYMSVRTGLDRIEGKHFQQIRSEWVSTVIDKTVNIFEENSKLHGISEYQASEILASYTGPFVRVVSPDDPMITDVGFYDESGTPYLAVEIQSELSFSESEVMETLAGESPRFWLSEPPRVPILDPEGDRASRSIFTDMSIPGKSPSKDIILYSEESTSLYKMYQALDSFYIGGSNYSDIKPESIILSCAVRENEL